MKPDDSPFGSMLHALQERAKELTCLYQVGELLGRSDQSLEEILGKIVEVLPRGWQYPQDCRARITFESLVLQPEDFQATPWVQAANIVVQGEIVGTVAVSYRTEMPPSDEGPFLKEERKLIETIAERISIAIVQRRLKGAFEALATADSAPTVQAEWRIVLEFLRDTDPALLKRISRKLINQLSWSGVPEAKELLQGRGDLPFAVSGLTQDENRPLPRDERGTLADLTGEAFQIAADHMSEREILDSVTVGLRRTRPVFS